ncbi:MAG: DUF4114 domain-containing protein [Thiohalocapsa sp.]|jgi:hypothetical protein|uniref:DUF4114 domain-containing protein n=1 Tax=Thiohalocapsa sp. TaxID=2497641 RepID=UPI0025E55A65|nr:DUF4114 domain-containing protein [Thiohalocapsa sp.]MCG6943174.1 DUF4114 domain-containing protein [Thiohalocapsa sp.]
MKKAFGRLNTAAGSLVRLCALSSALALLFATSQAAAVSDLSADVYSLDVDTEYLNKVAGLLPEYQVVNPAFVNSAVDPNLHLLEQTQVSITFLDEGAGYENSFGYFLFDDEYNILDTQTIFANASEETAKVGGGAADNLKFGGLEAGDTVDLGVFDAGTNIGFWLKGNGFVDPNGYTYYTLDHLNPDDFRHVAMIADEASERVVLGIEDMYNLGDQDYNDIVFSISASSFSALDISSLPTGAPEAGPMATALICASLFGVYARRRKAGARAGRAFFNASHDLAASPA